MKKVTIFIAIQCLISISFSQKINLEADTFLLSNGLKVILCEDHSKPEIFGAVCVHVGSKNDPIDATGMAHYFEHIMFKGTDKIGTTDWGKEKILLDSISLLYDKLHETSDEKQRKDIQQKINELSIKASQYAIPNEVSSILKKMGGKGINAFTSYDITAYFNSFPSNELENWMDVYVERFRNPVFRLFQSELETVYEEKNMYNDNVASKLMEDGLKLFYGEHPYGRPIIGYGEHLKNPQISRIQEFFNTYYVANNMTLILVGNFNSEEIKSLIKTKFGKIRSGDLPVQPTYSLPDFNGVQIVNVRQTPIKVGVIAFRGTPSNHKDRLKLEICSRLFSNDASTGLLDKLEDNNKLMAAMTMNMSLKEHGMFGILYLPKILGQSHEKAEKLIFDCIDSVKNANFSDDLLEAIKMEYISSLIQQFETMQGKFLKLLYAEMEGNSWDDFLKDMESVNSFTKQDMADIAKKFLKNDYLLLRSKMGFPKKEKIKKPDWKPIPSQNNDQISVFAQEIANRKTEEITPQIIDFSTDISISELNNKYTVYAVKNPYNDIFTLDIIMNYGSLDDRDLDFGIDYWELQGTTSKSYDEFNLILQKLGASMDMGTSNGNCYISIKGFENDLDTILKLCSEKLYFPNNDESKLTLLIDNYSASIKANKKEPSGFGDAVFEYALYQEQSEFLRFPALSEVKTFTGNYLLEKITKPFQRDGYIAFVGNTAVDTLQQYLNAAFLWDTITPKTEISLLKEKKYTENQVFFIHSNKLRQSNIHFYVQGENTNEHNKPIIKGFNAYFGSDMYSIVFQEIREFRSLSYAVTATYNIDHFNRKPGYLSAYMGTQSDKTIEGIKTMNDLIANMPQKPEKFKTAKESLIKANASDYIIFRQIPFYVHRWKKQGYDKDPRIEQNEQIKTMTFDDLLDFYQKTISKKPVIITLSGNMKQTKKEELQQFGKIVELKYKDIFKE
jgi:predicted Zn-dependent peptidase